jgi:hypothetical protein
MKKYKIRKFKNKKASNINNNIKKISIKKNILYNTNNNINNNISNKINKNIKNKIEYLS